MTYKGVLTAILLAAVIGGISYLFSPSIALIILGIFYMVLGIGHMTNKPMYDKIITMINVDKYNAYQEKDEEFKFYIKDNSASMISIGGVLLYFSYRWYGQVFSINYSVVIMLLVFGSYFVDAYSMTKSKGWEDYKKKNVMIMIVLVALAALILRL